MSDYDKSDVIIRLMSLGVDVAVAVVVALFPFTTQEVQRPRTADAFRPVPLPAMPSLSVTQPVIACT